MERRVVSEQWSSGDSITIRPNRSGKLWSEDPDQWRALCTMKGCPWCQGPGPPEEDLIAETDTCWVTAPRTATLPGYVCVSIKSHVVEPYGLDDDERVAFFGDAMAVARGLAKAVHPAKMNYEIHGNTVPHLHMHLFPRIADDPYVGYVITSRVWFTRTAEQIGVITDAVRAELAASGATRPDGPAAVSAAGPTERLMTPSATENSPPGSQRRVDRGGRPPMVAGVKAHGPHLYVVAERGDTDGPVKLGIHEGSAARAGRAGLSSGNWRELEVLHREPVELRDLRWCEWLIHRRLRDRHVRGEWFQVRDFVRGDDWAEFLGNVLSNRLAGLYDWRLGDSAHHLVKMERVGRRGDRRQFRALCSCGNVTDGEPGQALSTVQVAFALTHVGLAPSDLAIREVRRQIHHRTEDDLDSHE